MDRVLEAINTLQAVPFCINEPVLKFMLQMGAPPGPRGEKPDVWQKTRFERWMDAFNRVTEWDTDMATAMMLAAADRFWVPLNIDYRGRLYGIPHFNFTRADRVRGLFLFANGKPIGVEGLRWLKAHVARTANGCPEWSREARPADLDLAGRIAWTDDNLPMLRQIGEAILRADVTIAWALPKDRYQFAAACVELIQALDQGPEKFITRLPIVFDASTSGMQHMLAIMRAKSGRYVNIVSSAKPAFDWTDEDGIARSEPAEDMGDDFYRRVGTLVFDSGVVEYFSWSHWGMFLHEVAHILMDGPFDRAIIKPAGVAEFYGSRGGGWKDGQWVGMTKSVVEVLTERGQKRFIHAAPKLAAAICRARDEVAPEATVLRKWLRDLAMKCARKDKPLRWTSVLGLPVINERHEPEMKNLSVKLNGRRRSMKFAVGDKPEISEKDAVKAVAANFVHSLDACHLQMVVLAATEEGIEMASVHDCFGTIAPDAARLKEILPERFVHLHKRHNLLASVYTWAKRVPGKDTPSIPKIGNAEIDLNFRAFS
jgi:DNA-directed RNA polymerase, mitochondrial